MKFIQTHSIIKHRYILIIKIVDNSPRYGKKTVEIYSSDQEVSIYNYDLKKEYIYKYIWNDKNWKIV